MDKWIVPITCFIQNITLLKQRIANINRSGFYDAFGKYNIYSKYSCKTYIQHTLRRGYISYMKMRLEYTSCTCEALRWVCSIIKLWPQLSGRILLAQAIIKRRRRVTPSNKGQRNIDTIFYVNFSTSLLYLSIHTYKFTISMPTIHLSTLCLSVFC